FGIVSTPLRALGQLASEISMGFEQPSESIFKGRLSPAVLVVEEVRDLAIAEQLGLAPDPSNRHPSVSADVPKRRRIPKLPPGWITIPIAVDKYQLSRATMQA